MKQSIEDRLIEEPDFYIRVQKTKWIIAGIGLIICLLLGRFEPLFVFFT